LWSHTGALLLNVKLPGKVPPVPQISAGKLTFIVFDCVGPVALRAMM
jgi:hypothetical protein